MGNAEATFRDPAYAEGCLPAGFRRITPGYGRNPTTQLQAPVGLRWPEVL